MLPNRSKTPSTHVARIILLAVCCFLAAFTLIAADATAATFSVTPSTWDTIGLDSNSPTTGPNVFPVGAKLTGTPNASGSATLVWDTGGTTTTDEYIRIRNNQTLSFTFDSSGKADVYFEVEVARRDITSYNQTRRYHISSGSVDSVVRELFIERLVSQGRNAITDMMVGTSPSNLVSVPSGGSFSLIEDNEYYIRLVGYTATSGYEQLEAFINFDNTVIQILSVVTTGSALPSSPTSPINNLYADACSWDAIPDSPTYRSCLASGKFGGDITVTYKIKVLKLSSSTSQQLNSLIHDFSGSSFHYNADYSTTARTMNLVVPTNLGFEKSFSPNPANANGVSTLTFTLTNPNAGSISGVNFTDDLATVAVTPSGGVMKIAATPNASTSCGTTASITATAGGSLISLTNGTIPASGSCTVQVNVTTTQTGSYANTSGNLFVGIKDTGTAAAKTLEVNDTPTPPVVNSYACTTPVKLVAWTMEETPHSSPPTPVYLPGSKQADVTTATSSFQCSGTCTQTVVTGVGSNATYAWGASAPGTSWAENPTAPSYTLNNYFQFVVDTSKYTGVRAIYDIGLYDKGDYANPTSSGFVTTSTDGTNFTLSPTPAPALDKGKWYTGQVATAAATGTGTTTFRFATNGATKAAAKMYLDNVAFWGCVRPDATKLVLTKSFSPAKLKVTDTSQLTFTITNNNPATSPNLTGISFTDTLPAANLTGTVAVATGSTSVTGTGTKFLSQLGAGSIVKINGQSLSVASITSDTALILNSAYTAGPPNSNLVMSAGLTVASSGPTSVCGGTLTTTAPDTISFSGGTLTTASPGNTCSFNVNVKANAAGSFTNVSGTITSTETGKNTSATGYATAKLTAILPPVITKKFLDNPVVAGGVSTLAFYITNLNQDPDNGQLTAVGFSDTFPNSPGQMKVAATPNSSSSCGGTVTAAANDTSISFSGGAINPGAFCTVMVDVTAPVIGTYTNTSGAVTAAITGNGNTASDTLTTTAGSPAIGILKEIATSATPTLWNNYVPVAINGKVYYKFSLYNDGDVPLSDVTVNDPLLGGLLTNCVWYDGDDTMITNVDATGHVPPNKINLVVYNTSNNRDFAYCITGPYNVTAAGTVINTATASVTYNGTLYSDSDWAKYGAFTVPTAAKSVTTPFQSGATTTMTLTLTNPLGNPGAITARLDDTLSTSGLSLKDAVFTFTPAPCGTVTRTDGSASIAGDGSVRFTATNLAANSSCQVQLNVTSTTVGAATNTTAQPEGTAPVATTGGTAAAADFTVLGQPLLSVVKFANTGSAAPGQTVTYTIQVSNSGAGNGKEVLLTDDLSIYTAFGITTYPSTGTPFNFTDSGSGLTFGTPEYYIPASGWSTTTPADDGGGFNNSVTKWRILMNGSIVPGGGFTLNYRTKVK